MFNGEPNITGGHTNPKLTRKVPPSPQISLALVAWQAGAGRTADCRARTFCIGRAAAALDQVKLDAIMPLPRLISFPV